MFGWSFLDSDGEEIGRSQQFADPESAEAWIGTSWPDLMENGVQEVVLFDCQRDRRLYRMGLGAD